MCSEHSFLCQRYRSQHSPILLWLPMLMSESLVDTKCRSHSSSNYNIPRTEHRETRVTGGRLYSEWLLCPIALGVLLCNYWFIVRLFLLEYEIFESKKCAVFVLDCKYLLNEWVILRFHLQPKLCNIHFSLSEFISLGSLPDQTYKWTSCSLDPYRHALLKFRMKAVQAWSKIQATFLDL